MHGRLLNWFIALFLIVINSLLIFIPIWMYAASDVDSLWFCFAWFAGVLALVYANVVYVIDFVALCCDRPTPAPTVVDLLFYEMEVDYYVPAAGQKVRFNSEGCFELEPGDDSVCDTSTSSGRC